MTRQEIYDRIKNSTKDAVILEEMKKLGFWKEDGAAASVPEQLILREASLRKDLNELLQKQRNYQNRDLALKDMRAARMEASRKKQAENKLLRKEKAEKKAAAWKEKKQKDITYLGEAVSTGLNNAEANTEKLQKSGLPLIESAEKLAALMQISISELRFVAYNRVVSEITHYKKFQLPKKTGGFRTISAPLPRLKSAQHWILQEILNKLPVHAAAHGFVTKRSIVSNAKEHLQNNLLINIDLKDFFPSIHYPRVKGFFKAIGYSEQVATIFALICTESEVDEIELDKKTYYVKSGDRSLPQGAPTSPAITNLLCRRLDARFAGLAKKYGFVYTRYADDLSFSAPEEKKEEFKKFIGFVKKTIKAENFTLHPDKFKVLRKGARREVTGIVVNQKLSVSSDKVKKFRALLFQIEKDGIAGKHWNGSTTLLASIKGYASFIYQVDPVKGKPMLERVNKILVANAFKHIIVHKSKAQKEKEAPKKQAGIGASTKTTSDTKKPWWKIW
ncbi:MAG: retron-type reverse transcriptase [Bacteroidetes bacterium]|nr:retron-type reverse transcriptase [Bacteroidota bacterium]